MPVVKHTAEYEYASECFLEGILSAWDFMKDFYRYEYVFWRLKQFFFSEFANFILRFRSLSRKTHAQKRDITHKENNSARKVKGTWVESLLILHSLEMYVRITRSAFSLSRRICLFLKFLSALWKGRHVQSTNSNRPSYLHPNVPDSIVLHLSDSGGTFHLALHLRLLNSEGSNQDVTLRNEASGSCYNREV